VVLREMETWAGLTAIETREELIVNVAAGEVPPPGVGLTTDTAAVPAVRISAAVKVAVSCVAVTKVVPRFDPLNRTVEPVTNPVPFTVSVKAGPPARAEDGESEETVGEGLEPVGLYLPQLARNTVKNMIEAKYKATLHFTVLSPQSRLHRAHSWFA